MLRNVLFFICAAGFAACPPTTGKSDSGTEVVNDVDAGLARSAKGNLRFKSPERIKTDFAQALELQGNQVCNELGFYSCTDFAHPLALGGIDPYGSGLYESSGNTGASTPIVIDRIAWSACTARAGLDVLSSSNAVIFKNFGYTLDRKIADPNSTSVRAAIESLFQRILLRDPTEAEVARLVSLVKDIEATKPAEPAFAWMQSACFIVLSSSESVFY